MVKVTKRCLKKVLNKNTLNYEGFCTLLLKVENVINNRPLTFCYDNPGDYPLTPNHLLFGRNINFESHKNVYDSDFDHITDLNSRLKYINTIFNHYWQRWRIEYVTELREFHKSQKRSGELVLKPNDVVLISEDKISRSLWRVGVVKSVIK